MKKMLTMLGAVALGSFALDAAWAQNCMLRVTTWGGNYHRTYTQVAPEFEKQYNCKIEWVIGSTADHTVKARLGQADVVTNNLLFAVAGEKEGLWLALDEAKIPNLKNLYGNARYSPYTVWVNVGDFALAYNSQKIKEEPKSWEALWNPAYKNHVALYYFEGVPTLGLTIQQAQKAGGNYDNIEPGLKRVADLVKTGNAIALFEVESQMVSMFESGEAWIGPLASGRIKDLWDKGHTHIKFVRPAEGSFPVITAMNVVKSTKQPEMAMNFVNFALGESVQKAFAVNNLYAPTNKTVAVPADFKYRDLLIQGEAVDRLFRLDDAKLNAVKAQWREKFDRLIK
jgi:putative spermidine/putrescine transport system substrate-binding protein